MFLSYTDLDLNKYAFGIRAKWDHSGDGGERVKDGRRMRREESKGQGCPYGNMVMKPIAS